MKSIIFSLCVILGTIGISSGPFLEDSKSKKENNEEVGNNHEERIVYRIALDPFLKVIIRESFYYAEYNYDWVVRGTETAHTEISI